MLYWVLKLFVAAPALRLVCRPWIEGEENVPASGPAILVSNHLSAGDPVLLPAMLKRRVTFPAKAELFEGRSLRGRLTAFFVRNVGMIPLDRSGGRASATSVDGLKAVLADGDLLGIYPEGTRSPDGRLYKGKTGAARIVLSAGVPVVPVGMFNTQMVRSRFLNFPIMRRPGIRIGRPLDFTAYAEAGNNRDVLRFVTDEIMNAVMELSGQEYVDVYATSVKAAADEGRELSMRTLPRPGYGRPVPPPPGVAELGGQAADVSKIASPIDSPMPEPGG